MTRDRFDDDLGASELVRALTAPGTYRELQGEDAAAAAFRDAAAGRGPRRRGRVRFASGLGATAAASGLLLSATAVTAAAYTSALPHAAQRTAHHLFHRLGVPGPAEPAPPAAAATGHRTGDADDHRGPSDPRLPRPAAAGPELRVDALSAVVGQVVHASVRVPGPLPAGALVLLEARHPGDRSWTVVARHAARAGQQVVLGTGPLVATVELRTVVQHLPGASPVVRVRVRPRLSLDLGRTADALTVRADAGERTRVVVLQELVAGSWHDVQRAALDAQGGVTFRLPPLEGPRRFRAVLARSALLDAGVSPVVRVPAR